LGSDWEYELGREKIREFRSSLAITESGEVPPGFVFAYAVVPGLARALVDPGIANERAGLRLASLEVAWTSTPLAGSLLRGRLLSVDSHGATIRCLDGEELVVDVRLGFSETDEVPDPEPGPVLGERITADAGRSLAFAAATWDLNPAYWNERFVAAAGLDATVVPPGLGASWVLQMIRRSSGRPLREAKISFGSAPRTGDELMGRVSASEDRASFIVGAGERAVCWGRATWGEDPL
jgi:acyl dehydratase